MKTRNKSLCVLEALFQGYRIKLKYGEVEYEFYWDVDRLCVDFEGEIISDKIGKKTYHTLGFPNISLSLFVKMCNKKMDDEIFIINANMALTKINKNRNGKGERKI